MDELRKSSAVNVEGKKIDVKFIDLIKGHERNDLSTMYTFSQKFHKPQFEIKFSLFPLSPATRD